MKCRFLFGMLLAGPATADSNEAMKIGKAMSKFMPAGQMPRPVAQGIKATPASNGMQSAMLQTPADMELLEAQNQEMQAEYQRWEARIQKMPRAGDQAWFGSKASFGWLAGFIASVGLAASVGVATVKKYAGHGQISTSGSQISALASTASTQPRISVRPASTTSEQSSMSYVCATVEVPSFFGMMSRSKVVGYVTVREELDEAHDARRAYLSNLRIVEEYRGIVRINGRRSALAVELMRQCEAIARDWGYDETHLSVYESNQKAARLYVDKLGYEVVSVKPSGSRRKKVLRMRKLIGLGAGVGVGISGAEEQEVLASAGQHEQRELSVA